MKRRKQKSGLFVAVFFLTLLTGEEVLAQTSKCEYSPQETAKLQEITLAISDMA